MEFSRRNAIGLSGQQFFCSYINYELGWIGRGLGDPDIGLDAEIEIIDPSRNSTGRLLRVQIKSTESSILSGGNPRVLYVDVGHIDYWRYYSLPVVLCAVSLADRKIWWKEICYGSWAPTSGNSYSISFDLTADLLSITSKPFLDRISMGVVAPAMDLIREMEKEVIEYRSNRDGDSYDIVSYEQWSNFFRNRRDEVREAAVLISSSRMVDDNEKTRAENVSAGVEYYWKDAAFFAHNGRPPYTSDELEKFINPMEYD